jgi:hypothetical protein
VAQDVKRPGGDAGGLAVAGEPLGKPVGADRAAKRIGEDKIAIVISGAGEVTLE